MFKVGEEGLIHEESFIKYNTIYVPGYAYLVLINFWFISFFVVKGNYSHQIRGVFNFLVVLSGLLFLITSRLRKNQCRIVYSITSIANISAGVILCFNLIVDYVRAQLNYLA